MAPGPLGSGSKFCIPVLTGLWTGFDVIYVHTTRSGFVEGVGVEGFAGSGIWALHQSLGTSLIKGSQLLRSEAPPKSAHFHFFLIRGGKLIVSQKATAFGTSLHQFLGARGSDVWLQYFGCWGS